MAGTTVIRGNRGLELARRGRWRELRGCLGKKRLQNPRSLADVSLACWIWQASEGVKAPINLQYAKGVAAIPKSAMVQNVPAAALTTREGGQ
jgi:hypothetical protein